MNDGECKSGCPFFLVNAQADAHWFESSKTGCHQSKLVTNPARFTNQEKSMELTKTMRTEVLTKVFEPKFNDLQKRLVVYGCQWLLENHPVFVELVDLKSRRVLGVISGS